MNFFHVSCKRFLGAVVPLIVLSSVQAGALITLKHEVVIGDIVEKEAVLEVSMQYGMIQHPKETVVWFDTNKAITSAYHAAGAAYRKGEVEEAKFLLKHSVKTEPEFAARATKILDDLSPSLARTSTAIPSTQQPRPSKRGSAPRYTALTPPSAMEGIFKPVSYELINGKLEKADTRITENTKYYVVYLSASWCGPCHRYTPKLVTAYSELKKQYNDLFEVIFVSCCRSEQDMIGYATKYNMPWTITKYGSSAPRSFLNEFEGGGIPSLYVFKEDGSLIMSCYSGPDRKYVSPEIIWKNFQDYLAENEKP